MVPDLARALAAAVAVGVAPGWFWASCLCRAGDPTVRLALSTALSATLVPAVALALTRLFGAGVSLPLAAGAAAAVFASGLAARLGLGQAKDADEPGSAAPSAVSGGGWGGAALPRVALGVVLALALLRGYLGPVVHDWPFVRGGDQYSHAVMAGLMLSEGSVGSYLIYPAGFHAMTAMVSRLSGLDPLEIFPVLGPALSVLTPLACYALARRLAGPWAGVTAALFSGLLLVGPHQSLAEARYPNLVSADFLMVLAVAALIGVYDSPSWRSGSLLALLGSAVVLYHQVATLYAAVLLALVAALLLPPLLLRDRSRGLALLLSLAILGVLAVAYAWGTYDLPGLVSGLVGGSGGEGGEAVAIVIGSQEPLGFEHLAEMTSWPVLVLGPPGAVLLALGAGGGPRPRPARLLAAATMALWCGVLFAGSLTSLSGFPQRFERDLGPPLAVLAAVALVAVLRRAGAPSVRVPLKLAATAVAVVAVAATGLRAAENLRDADAWSANVISPPAAAAGRWLGDHNTGGNVVVTPYLNDHVPGSAMLAMGGYTGLRSYTRERLRTPRALPASGKEPLLAADWVQHHPSGGRTASILRRYEVGYVVFSKRYPGVPWRAFDDRPDLYEKAFENEAVVVFAPSPPTPGTAVR